VAEASANSRGAVARRDRLLAAFSGVIAAISS